jgi:CBS domain-containing protein
MITMRARDIMASPAYTVRDIDTVEHAAALLAGKAVAAAPVVDADGTVVGMISEGDLLRGRLDTTVETATAADLMTRTVVSVSPETDVVAVAKALLDHAIHSAPVLDDGRLVGIVGQRDVLRTLIRDDDVVSSDVQHRLDEYADGARRWTATVHEGTATVHGPFTDDAERTVVMILAGTVPGVLRIVVDTSAT